MRRMLCAVLGHKVRRHRRFLLIPGRIERCERCGRRIELS